MDSWLKRAEDLFEVVDRRAKLVVGELAEESADSESPGSNGQGSNKKAKPKTRAPRRLLSTNETAKASNLSKEETPKESDAVEEVVSAATLQQDITTDQYGAYLIVENGGTTSSKSLAHTSIKPQQGALDVVSSIPMSDSVAEQDHQIVPVNGTDETATSSSNGDLINKMDSDVPVEHPTVLSPTKEKEVVDEGQTMQSRDVDVLLKVDQEKSQTFISNSPAHNEAPVIDVDAKVVQPFNEKKQRGSKADASPMKFQDQLDEAQGLLKNTVSTGQSKEARLARVCAGLQMRLQEYKSENAQLEELLIAERELSKSCEARIKQLQEQLSISKSEVTRMESNMLKVLAAKNSEIEVLAKSIDALKKQATLAEGNLASLQANMESIMRNRELTETRMMQALREELATTERRAEEERVAHNATKMAAMEREVELERRAVEASTTLARIQRITDERTAKATELEQKVALLEVECSSLNQELQDIEACARREQKKSPEEANQVIQVQAWQEEVERARQGQRDSDSKVSALEAELQKMRVEMAAMKRDAEHYSRQEHMELEKRYRELTDLLYYKQTQLETITSEKAAAEFQLEKEVKRLQEAQFEAERSKGSRRASSSWDEDTEMKALEPLPLYHRHMVGASLQLQKAAKLLDSGAARATRFLWRYPTARLILLFYLVFVHLFLMYLLHRFQEQVDSFSAQEIAESMGLRNHTLS